VAIKLHEEEKKRWYRYIIFISASYSTCYSTVVSAGREFSRKGARNRFARARESNDDRECFPRKDTSSLPAPFILSSLPVSRGELALPFRVATSRFSRQGAVFGRLLTDSTGSSQSLVPRMAARRASVRSAVRSQRRGDFVMKNFRLASGSACQAWSRTSGRTNEPCCKGPCHYFPQPPYVSMVPLG